jgi:hypothetical protein
MPMGLHGPGVDPAALSWPVERGPLAHEAPLVADGEAPAYSIWSWKRPSEGAPQASLLVVAQPEEQRLAEQVAQLVRGRVGVAEDLGLRLRALEAGVIDEEVDRSLDADLAAMEADVEDDPAGPPDRVGVHREARLGADVEALLAHHLLGVHAPALDELRGVDEDAHQRGVGVGAEELEVVPGVASWMLVFEIEERLCSRIAPGLPSTDGVTM